MYYDCYCSVNMKISRELWTKIIKTKLITRKLFSRRPNARLPIGVWAQYIQGVLSHDTIGQEGVLSHNAMGLEGMFYPMMQWDETLFPMDGQT